MEFALRTGREGGVTSGSGPLALANRDAEELSIKR